MDLQNEKENVIIAAIYFCLKIECLAKLNKHIVISSLVALTVILSLLLPGCYWLDPIPQLMKQGEYYYAQKQYNQAIEVYSEVIKRDLKNSLAYANRALCYNQIGKYDLAIDDCNKAIELYPKLVIAYVARATAYVETGEYDLAIADCNKALSINSRFAQAIVNRGWAQYKKGNYNQAIADCTTAIGVDPKLAYAFVTRALCYN
jgi:tetratricopeptide (TPR) repeat protein